MIELYRVLTDFVIMVENEITYIKTGKNNGPTMRAAIDQWESTVHDGKEALRLYRDGALKALREANHVIHIINTEDHDGTTT